MKGEKPKVLPARRYTEGEATQILGVNRRTLKRWRDAGYAKCVFLPESRRVYYTGSELVKLWLTR